MNRARAHSIRQRRRRVAQRRRARIERAAWLGYIGLLVAAEGALILAGALAGFR